jgi:hypothetical protein
MEEEGPKVSGVRISEGEYKEAIGELSTQAAVDLERALIKRGVLSKLKLRMMLLYRLIRTRR